MLAIHYPKNVIYFCSSSIKHPRPGVVSGSFNAKLTGLGFRVFGFGFRAKGLSFTVSCQVKNNLQTYILRPLTPLLGSKSQDNAS